MFKKLVLLNAIFAAVSLQAIDQQDLNADLYAAITHSNPGQVKYLLSIGAERTVITREGSLIVVAQRIIDENPDSCEGYQVLDLLRTYAPDERTRVALEYVNAIREGNFTRDYLEAQSFPDYMIEYMAYLASFDPQAQAKWIEIGMPAYF